MRLFRAQGPATDFGPSGMIPIVGGDVLPSVNRRDPRRRGGHMDIWQPPIRI